MSEDPEAAVSAALTTLAVGGAITMPGVVSEQTERGYREQLIDGVLAASNHDPEFWERDTEQAIESFVRSAQSLAKSLAIRDYFLADISAHLDDQAIPRG